MLPHTVSMLKHCLSLNHRSRSITIDHNVISTFSALFFICAFLHYFNIFMVIFKVLEKLMILKILCVVLALLKMEIPLLK